MKFSKGLAMAFCVILGASGCGSDDKTQTNVGNAAAGYGTARFDGTWGLGCQRNTNGRYNGYEDYRVVIDGSNVQHQRNVYSDPECQQQLFGDVTYTTVNYGAYNNSNGGYYDANFQYNYNHVTPYHQTHAEQWQSLCPSGEFLVSRPHNITGLYCPEAYGYYGTPIIYTTPVHQYPNHYTGGQNYYSVIRLHEGQLYLGQPHGSYTGQTVDGRHQQFLPPLRRY